MVSQVNPNIHTDTALLMQQIHAMADWEEPARKQEQDWENLQLSIAGALEGARKSEIDQRRRRAVPKAVSDVPDGTRKVANGTYQVQTGKGTKRTFEVLNGVVTEVVEPDYVRRLDAAAALAYLNEEGVLVTEDTVDLSRPTLDKTLELTNEKPTEQSETPVETGTAGEVTETVDESTIDSDTEDETPSYKEAGE